MDQDPFIDPGYAREVMWQPRRKDSLRGAMGVLTGTKRGDQDSGGIAVSSTGGRTCVFANNQYIYMVSCSKARSYLLVVIEKGTYFGYCSIFPPKF